MAEIPTTSPAVLAGAKFYARASAHRAVHGTIPTWDDGADEANWERTRQSVRDGCIDMVRGILVAAEFPQRQADAADRAVGILDREAIKSRFEMRLNDYLCEMKPDYDNSIVGFNEAWDVIRKLFEDLKNGK